MDKLYTIHTAANPDELTRVQRCAVCDVVLWDLSKDSAGTQVFWEAGDVLLTLTGTYTMTIKLGKDTERDLRNQGERVVHCQAIASGERA